MTKPHIQEHGESHCMQHAQPSKSLQCCKHLNPKIGGGCGGTAAEMTQTRQETRSGKGKPEIATLEK